ncbi:1-phosphofructokinase family hexose kinase [Tepidimicrobium xylanilyticum]|uniref:1-phosphofructokinase family hexose kinase n=1 Tax=Tepidimicrobium xylanilyticum TaxID=1123352 RepID=UPI00265255A4|nr:1-phosphofructokinase family hexose kinase [Tepidimicrobium xylanilyticum]GMG95334.1 hypothetical protein EN5CB1_01600 [Tepidimicrobium xylanilyticum]
MIITVTLNPSLDLNVYVDKLKKNQNNRTKNMKYDIGGKATHVSLVLSALGIENIATGIMGGNNGKRLVKMMEDRGVDCDFVFQEGDETRVTYIIVQEEVEGTFMLTEPGFSIKTETFKKLKQKLREIVQKDDLIVISGGIPPGIDIGNYRCLLNLIEDVGGILVVDTSGECLLEAVKHKPYLIKPNEIELRELVGCELTDEKLYIKELKKLNNQGIEIVALSLGEKGSIISTKNKTLRIIPPNVVQVNDTGCGDIFLGGAVSMLYQGMNLVEAFRFATAIATSKVTKMGTSEFSLKETREYMKEVIIYDV